MRPRLLLVALPVLFVFTLSAVAVTASFGASHPGAAMTKATPLTGKVDDSFKISLRRAGGKALGTVKAGKYTITVKDTTGAHNFHLKGPGVNKTTGILATGTTTWTVTLKKGTYTYLCDVHPAMMKATFKVS